jgi:predicted Zn-dependent peptidase
MPQEATAVISPGTAARGATLGAGDPESSSPVSIQTTTLDAGLTVVTERMPDVRSVSLGFWVGTGSVDEAAAQAGASHFLEHLLFKGTEGRSARSIAESVDAVGGDINAFTTKEYTTFYVRLLSDDLPMGIDLMSDIIWSPAFRPDEVESERQVILEEILMHGDEPADLVHDVLAGALFPNHPLGREVMGDHDTVSAMTAAQLAAFHADHYRPPNIVVAAAGRLDHDAVVSALANCLKDRAGGSPPSRQAPGSAASGRVVLARSTEQAHLAVGLPGPDRDDEDRHAMSLVEHVLGGGMSSRLFQAIREERGLAYSVYSYRLGFEGAGAFAVYAGTAPAHASEVLDLIEAEIEKMATHGMTAAELAAAQSHVRGAMALGLEDSGARMSRIGHSQLIHRRILSLDEVEARLTAITLDQVNEAAARWLARARTVACVGPFPEGRPLDGGRAA